MDGGRTGNTHVRAWVLVKADSPQAVAKDLYTSLGHKGDDDWVVIRADVVDYAYGIMVPVHAKNPRVLEEVEEMIRSHAGVSDTVLLRVKRHFPFPPHIAHGYISEAELDAQRERGVTIEEELRPGRQGASPGHNPWG